MSTKVCNGNDELCGQLSKSFKVCHHAKHTSYESIIGTRLAHVTSYFTGGLVVQTLNATGLSIAIGSLYIP